MHIVICFTTSGRKKTVMGKIEKKMKKLQDRITEMENEMRISLTKKSSTTVEIDVPTYVRRISEMKKRLKNMK